MNLKKQDGFTMVELLVAILCGTMVMAVALTMLLVGLRLRAGSYMTAQQQHELRVVSSVLRQLTEEEVATELVTEGEAWRLNDKEGGLLLAYVPSEEQIVTQSGALMERVESSAAYEDSLLTVDITTRKRQTFRVCVCCTLSKTES